MAWKKKDESSGRGRAPFSGKIRRTGKGVSGELDDKTIEKYSSEDRERILDEKERYGKEEKEAARDRGERKAKKSFKERAASAEKKDVYRVRGTVDRPMLIIILVLVSFGCVMVFSASYAYALDRYGDSYYFIKKQLLYTAVGICAMAGVSFIDYKYIKRFTPLYFAVAFVLLIAVLGIGVASGVAKRWIDLKVFTIQPSEIMKLGLVLILALYYSKVGSKVREGGFWKTSAYSTFVPLLIVGAVAGLVLLEKHLSGTIIMFAIGMVVIWCAGGKPFWYGTGIVVFTAALIIVAQNFDYVAKRIDIWRHPENYSVQDDVWQTLQGIYAVGSGGVFGVGLGNSRQKHLFVSQPQNDFIFSIICEELGLIGAISVIALFIAFLVRGIIIARRAPDTFSKLTVIGIVSKVTIQALLNIAVVTNTIPNTGISLPFFSYGGTALIILFVEMGVLLSISRYTRLQT